MLYNTHTLTSIPFNSWYQKGKTNLDFTEARDSEWQWHQLGHVQVCTCLQTDNHASTPPLSFLQAGCPSCHPTNSVKALRNIQNIKSIKYLIIAHYKFCHITVMFVYTCLCMRTRNSELDYCLQLQPQYTGARILSKN